jgi:hypothetical protein
MDYSETGISRPWLQKVTPLEGVIKSQAPHDSWVAGNFSSEDFNTLTDSLEADLKSLHQEAAFIFSPGTETESRTRQTVDMIRHWQMAGHSPSLTAMCIFGLEHFKIHRPDLAQAVLMASVLGEIPNDLDYHNNMHYRKVLLQTLRMIEVHNNIYEGTARFFDKTQIALLLIAACVHDLGHDGLGNTVKGVFQSGRLERKSYDIAVPYLKTAGLADPTLLDMLKIMLLCTDVTPLDDPGNPMNQMKAAYRFHFLGDKHKTHTLNLDHDLQALQYDESLAMMSLILHEADIATSAGLSYELTKFETTIYMQEISKRNARPQYVIDFLNQICQRKLLSDAGQKLYGANLARIYALAQEAIKAGDEIFPPAEHSDFFIAGKESGASKTKH